MGSWVRTRARKKLHFGALDARARGPRTPFTPRTPFKGNCVIIINIIIIISIKRNTADLKFETPSRHLFLQFFGRHHGIWFKVFNDTITASSGLKFKQIQTPSRRLALSEATHALCSSRPKDAATVSHHEHKMP